jgi:hypothetical protein
MSEYVTCFTQLSYYAPNNVDTDEKKQDWFLNELNDGLAYTLEAHDLSIFKTWWTRLGSLKTEEELLDERERCSALELKEATRGSVMVLLIKGMCSILVSSKGCKLQRRDFKLHGDRFSAPTFSLLALHRRHHKGTIMHRILVL